MIKFTCSSCRKEIVGGDELSGRQGECPFCKQTITAPGKKIEPPQPTVTEDGIQDVPRCPKCGARRQEKKKTCGFCGAALEPVDATPKTRRAEAKTGRQEAAAGGLDRRKVILLGVVLGIGAIVAGLVFIGGGGSAPKLTPVEQCQSCMMQLGWSLQDYALAKSLPTGRGSQFWEPIVQGDKTRFRCPVGSTPGYRGPARTYADLLPDGILAACSPGNHPDGINVLLKSLDVHFAPTGSDLHKRALEETAD